MTRLPPSKNDWPLVERRRGLMRKFSRRCVSRQREREWSWSDDGDQQGASPNGNELRACYVQDCPVAVGLNLVALRVFRRATSLFLE